MLPNSIRAQLQKQTNRWLTETAFIERESDTRGIYGEQVHDWETVALNVKCRVITSGGGRNMNEMMGNQELMIDQYKIVLVAGTDVSVDYRITVGGHVYRVTKVMDDRTDELDVHVLVERER